MVVVEENTTDNSWGTLIFSNLVKKSKNIKLSLADIILLGSSSELISANIKKEKENLIDADKIYNYLVDIL